MWNVLWYFPLYSILVYFLKKKMSWLWPTKLIWGPINSLQLSIGRIVERKLQNTWQGSTRRVLPEVAFHSFHDYSFFRSIRSTMQWTKTIMAICSSLSSSDLGMQHTMKAAGKWHLWTVPSQGNEASIWRKLMPRKRFVCAPHQGCRRAVPFPHLDSHSGNNSLFLYGLFEELAPWFFPRVWRVTDDSEKPNPRSESGEVPPLSLPSGCLLRELGWSWKPLS